MGYSNNPSTTSPGLIIIKVRETYYKGSDRHQSRYQYINQVFFTFYKVTRLILIGWLLGSGK